MNDPITTQRPRPAASGLLLKAAVVIPDVIISSLLWLVISPTSQTRGGIFRGRAVPHRQTASAASCSRFEVFLHRMVGRA